MREHDCRLAGGWPFQATRLGGAYRGWFTVYLLRVRIRAVNFDTYVRAVAAPDPPKGFDGIAGFQFLCRFTYGNFDGSQQFGLE